MAWFILDAHPLVAWLRQALINVILTAKSCPTCQEWGFIKKKKIADGKTIPVNFPLLHPILLFQNQKWISIVLFLIDLFQLLSLVLHTPTRRERLNMSQYSCRVVWLTWIENQVRSSPGRQWHRYPLMRSWQMLPWKQGFEPHSFTSSSQKSPANPAGHLKHKEMLPLKLEKNFDFWKLLLKQEKTGCNIMP